MHLKVISLNLYQGLLLDAACDFLHTERPDVVLLQEVYNGTDPALAPRYRSLQELLDRLDFKYHDYEAALIDNRQEGKIPEGNAILSRFPITDRSATFFNEPFRDDYVDDITNNPTQPHVLLHAHLHTPAGEVDVFNVHGPWDLVGENDSPKRRQMVAAILEGVKGKECVVVGGDTNAKPVNAAWQPLNQVLMSVFGNDLPSSFNMRRKTNPGYATAAVDMLFVSHNIRVLSKDCPDVDISDHRPLVVNLEIPTTAPKDAVK